MKVTPRSILRRLAFTYIAFIIAAASVGCTDGSLSGLSVGITPTVASTSVSPTPPAPTKEVQADTNPEATPFRREPTSEPEKHTTSTHAPSPTQRPIDEAQTPTASPTNPIPQPDEAQVLVGAGDIASCDSSDDEKTAQLLDRIAGTVFTLGDNAYDEGKASEYNKCYDPTWGRHKARTRPASGNHDYRSEGASPYFVYFGKVAGDPRKGYYSYDLGAWHVVVLNSNCDSVGGCGSDSDQVNWLRDDLASHPAPCTLAYWHHPRFSSGRYEDKDELKPFWQALYDAGADVVMSGHDHNYQRYAPQDPDGNADPSNGIRQFVVGTGGKSLYNIERESANLEVSRDDTYGVLELTLSPNNYAWEFIPVEGKTFTDSGSAQCH